MTKTLTILDQTGFLTRDALPEGYRLMGPQDRVAPWMAAQGADVLCTVPAVWRGAPATRPAGWPGGLRHFHAISAGMDAFPDWIFEVPDVTCGRGTTSGAIADYVFAVLLEAEKRLGVTLLGLAPDRPKADFPPGGLEGRVLAIIGYGSVAQAIIRRAAAFGMTIRVLRRKSAVPDGQVQFVTAMAGLLEGADYAVLAVPLTPQTRGLAGAAFFAAAPPHLHLINVARGEVLDQEALRGFLHRCSGARATLDVTTPEPLPAGHWMLSHPQVRITPHISWKDHGYARRCQDQFLRNLTALRDGQVPIGGV